MPKPDPKNAPAPRVLDAHKLAEIFLRLAYCYHHPRQVALLVEHMVAAGNGFDIGQTVRGRRNHAFNGRARLELALRLLETQLDDLTRMKLRHDWLDELDKLAKSGKAK